MLYFSGYQTCACFVKCKSKNCINNFWESIDNIMFLFSNLAWSLWHTVLQYIVTYNYIFTHTNIYKLVYSNIIDFCVVSCPGNFLRHLLVLWLSFCTFVKWLQLCHLQMNISSMLFILNLYAFSSFAILKWLECPALSWKELWWGWYPCLVSVLEGKHCLSLWSMILPEGFL